MSPNIRAFALFSVFAIAVGFAVYVILCALRAAKAHASKQAELYHQWNRLFVTIHEQRHDIRNHLQIIHAMASMGRYEALKNYAAQLRADTEETDAIIGIGHPTLAALLQAKLTDARVCGIELAFEFVSLDSRVLDALSLDLVKIIGNLLDNAFDEVRKLAEDERIVEILGYRADDRIVFTVRNPCARTIDDAVLPRLFQAGFTTKTGGKHNGLGLAIALKRAEAHGGTIVARGADDNGIEFKVTIPLPERRDAQETHAGTSLPS